LLARAKQSLDAAALRRKARSLALAVIKIWFTHLVSWRREAGVSAHQSG
jgi:hypothetical protein